MDDGWGFVRLMEDDGQVYAIVGRPSGLEDRAFALSLASDVPAAPERLGSKARIERILGRWKHRWVVLAREEGLRYVMLCGACEPDGEPDRVLVSENTARLVQIGGHVVGLCGDAPRAEVVWLEALGLGWEDVDGCEALHDAQHSWFDLIDFMLPAFSVPVPVLCEDSPSLFQLGVRRRGYEGVLCAPA